MQEITEQLEAELGTPPPAPTFDVRTTIAAGRRAVRRRRLTAGGAALALALVVGGAGVAVTSQFGDGPGRDTSVLVAAGVSDAGLEPTDGLADESPAAYDPQDDKTVQIRSGWEVVERIEDPVTGMITANQTGPVTDSVALALRKGDTLTWVVLWHFAKQNGVPSWQGGSGVSETEAESGYATLTSWLDHQRTLTFQAAR